MSIKFTRPDLPEDSTMFLCSSGEHDDCEGMWPWPAERARSKCGCECHEIEVSERELAA